MALHPDAVVVRGGPFKDYRSLERPIQVAREAGLGSALSVLVDIRCTDSGPGMSLEELCEHLKHDVVRLTTVGQLEAVGIRLVQTGHQPTHHSAILSDPVRQSAEAFISCFGDPIPKPAQEEGTGST